MNKLIKISVLTAGVFAISLPTAFAADVANSAPSTPATAPAARPAMRRGPLARMMIRHKVAEKIGLTADQIAQLKSARQSAAASLKAIRADATLTPDQKRQRVREVVANTRTQMRAVLTPEQQAKLQEIRAHARQARGS